jgi:hypothetical protein
MDGTIFALLLFVLWPKYVGTQCAEIMHAYREKYKELSRDSV